MENEGFYVLKGKFAFPYRNSVIHAGKGQFVYSQRGKLHTYRNIGDDVGKLLVVITPADFENFFNEIGVLVSERLSSFKQTQITPADIEKVI